MIVAAQLRHADVTDWDLPVIMKRCELKSKGLRWAVDRLTLPDTPANIRRMDKAIFAQAKELPNCFLWMNHPRTDLPENKDAYFLAADCFESLAICLELSLAGIASHDRKLFEVSLDLTARAQSELRAAVQPMMVDGSDSDQQIVYHWLKKRAASDQYFIKRHMTLADAADPSRTWATSNDALELLDMLEPLEA